jgi:hypothetical protein
MTDLPTMAAQWQPIETAPRDGTDVLLLRNPPYPPIVAGFYDNGEVEGWASYDHPNGWIGGHIVGWTTLPAPPVTP